MFIIACCVFIGCTKDSMVNVNESESSVEKNNTSGFLTEDNIIVQDVDDEVSKNANKNIKYTNSKDDINLDFEFYIYGYSEGVWGAGAYDALCIRFNGFGVDYYVVALDEKIYTVFSDELIISEKYMNTLIDKFQISAFDWEGNLLYTSVYINTVFFSPNINEKLEEILYIKDQLTHLWIIGPEHNRHDEYNNTVNMSHLSDFKNIESLILSSNVKYVDFNLTELISLYRLHTLLLRYHVTNLGFLSQLPNLINLEVWLDEGYEYKNFGKIESLKRLKVYSNHIKKLNMLSNFPNLEKLDIQSKSIEDLSDISALKILKDVALKNVDSLSEVDSKDISNTIESLIVFGTKHVDYSFLNNFDSVNELRIINSNISDISFLVSYNDLTILDLNRSFTALHKADCSEFIKDKTKLTTLILPIDYYNYCTECNGGTNMKKEHKQTDISFLASLNNLQSLEIDIENIDDISAIFTLDSLKDLVLANVEDISQFENNLIGLNSLVLLNSSIEDFNPLSNLVNLRKFYIYENYVYDSNGDLNSDYEFDFSFLKNLISLKHIGINNFNMYYKIKNDSFPDLSNLSSLSFIEFESLTCSDISGVFNAPNVEKIRLSECEIENIDMITKLGKLRILDAIYFDLDKTLVSKLYEKFGEELVVLQ